MKKLLAIFTLVAFVAIGTTSCKFVGKQRLKQDIEASNEDCPSEVEGLGTLSSIQYDEYSNMVVFNFSLSSDNKDVFEMMQSDPAFVKNMIRIAFSDETADSKDCLKMVVDADGGMRAVFGYGGQEVSAELSNAECRELLSNPLSEQEQNKMMLSTVVNAVNATCPIDLGDGMIIERFYDDGTDVVVSIDTSDDLVAVLSDMRDDLNDMMREIMSGEDMKEMVEVCIANNRGVVYRYVGKNSGEKVNVRFSPEQLRTL